VIVPEVFPFSTPRLTAMERIFGRKVTDVAGLDDRARRGLAALIADALLAQPIWAGGGAGLFHADPHAGNLIATDDGRLGILDWSLTGRLGKDEQIEMTRILVGAVLFDAPRIRDAIGTLAAGAVDPAGLAGVIAASLDRLTGGVWPSLGWLTELMDQAVIQAGARFSGDLVMFRKVLQTLRGVVADVSEHCRLDLVLAARLGRQLAGETAARCWTLPASRRFASHLSNRDLTELALSAPLIGTRSWLGLGRELLGQRKLDARARAGARP
jgi:ubiquinone biosynthesis protein